jgi:hypothetical protein
MHDTIDGSGPQPQRAPLFPEGKVTVDQIVVGLDADVLRAAKNAEEIEKSGRVTPDDLRLQVSM